ncbi:MAG: hypothetical protein KJ556_21050, partial [Gammaproteobacteria bacterium]|nr:hypothetical protein [Gammaproteobacteria bacterium]
MSAYNEGTVTLVSGSTAVTGYGTAWYNEVDIGDLFVKRGDTIVYTVAGILSDTALALKETWPGPTVSGQIYDIVRDFTLNAQLPKLYGSDRSDWPGIMGNMLNRIDDWALGWNQTPFTCSFNTASGFTCTGDKTGLFSIGLRTRIVHAGGTSYHNILNSYYVSNITTVNFDNAIMEDPVSRVYHSIVSTGVSGIIPTFDQIIDEGTLFNLNIKSNSTPDFTANHDLNLDTGNESRVLTISGDAVVSNWFDQSVKTSASPTFNDGTFTGDLIVQGNITVSGDIGQFEDLVTVSGLTVTTWQDFTETAIEPATPAANKNRIYVEDQNGITRLRSKDSTGLIVTHLRDNLINVHNTSGSDMVKGQAVYISGSTGNTPNITLAKADSLDTLPAVGLLLENIDNNDFGRIMKFGKLSQINTSGFAEGDVLYVSAATAGAVVNVCPTYPNYCQRVGVVSSSGVGNGSIEIDPDSVERADLVPYSGALDNVDLGVYKITAASGIFNNLTATRLVQSDSIKRLTSVADFTAWVTGTANEVTVTNDGDGSITLSLPDDVDINQITAVSGLHNVVVVSGLTASRLIYGDVNKKLSSSDLINWVTGTVNQVTVTDDGDGSITLSTPQSTDPGASPSFNILTASGIRAGEITIVSGLTTSRLAATDTSKKVVS